MSCVLSIVGARPQFIKAAPVSRALRASGIREILVHTGQHYDQAMSDVFFKELGIIAPDLNLGVGSGKHAVQTAAMLTRLENAILDAKPDWVLVYGDTNSTLAGALAAAKIPVPLAHVEAGLRSFNRRMPEEINRVVTDALAAMLFVPTEVARRNLENEGASSERIHWTGDVMFDAMLMFREQAAKTSGILSRLDLSSKDFILATIHRAQNTDDPLRLRAFLDGLRIVAQKVRVILPLHPRTRARIAECQEIETAPIDIIEPVGFLDMIRLEMEAGVIATDSGGVQKEAFFHRVPCVTLREETEWVESVDLGWNRLVSSLQSETIARTILNARGSQGRSEMPYGDGRAAERIAEVLGKRTS